MLADAYEAALQRPGVCSGSAGGTLGQDNAPAGCMLLHQRLGYCFA
jgi:hypothetical protein